MLAATDVISLRIPHDLKLKLDKLVNATKRNKSDLLLHWIEDGVALEEWQLKEIEEGVREADMGQFASEVEADRVLNKWL